MQIARLQIVLTYNVRAKGRSTLDQKGSSYIVFQGVKSSKKYQSKNIISRYFVKRFMNTIIDLVLKTNVDHIKEIGCGEGHFALDYFIVQDSKSAVTQHKFTIRNININ